ncbi:efflux RND transporter periplasmic adaptor subunit [Beggiatoa leptomitoformis]|uniref:Efflux RND transporter periplasmic adaptor subunit n=1 Tax=Beggiatoa leptomitoformis TaxID=288004 RepID=A0A2N9YFZ4_9GAMM|nr:efflux RND transporter periplasmic adaptor subunit [Beggiatoa leptomitoformis]ALG68282.1 efflux RND transporter periplasmic adaptor subunit [Beggiatoa leptomitoformis]AUI69407.1 efflux RND transporter periplasmic adaptor subunit [Beggiatoa leptomitoformis]
MIRWFFAVIILSILLFGSIFGFNTFKNQKIAEFMANMPEPELPVEVLEVSSQTWQPAIQSIGYIEPYEGVNVTTSVAGMVKEIHFESGDKVKKGQLLVSLDSSVERANLNAAEARLSAAKNTWSRNQKVYERKLISSEAVEEVESAYKVAVAEVASLQATIERLEVKAPFSGQMGIRQVQLGQYLQPGNVIANLESNDEMRVRFIIPQKYLPEIRLNMLIELRTDVYPEQAFSGTLNAIEPSVDKESGIIQLQAKLPNPEQKLRSGMYATITIWQTTQANSIVVPQQAINFTLYGEMVYVVTKKQEADNKTVLRVNQKEVTVGERRGDDAVILTGLQTGDLLVTSGQVRLDNGAKVKIVTNDFVKKNQPIPVE